MSDERFMPRLVVKCPVCNHRVFDVVKGTKGAIEIKCPMCHHITKINVAFRLSNPNSRYYTRKCS